MRSTACLFAVATAVAVSVLSCESDRRLVGPASIGGPNASASAVSGTLEVWVTANPSGQDPTLVTRVMLGALTFEGCCGGTVRIDARVRNAAGRTIPAAIGYASGNASLLTVSGDGTVTALAGGQTYVRVSSGTLSQDVPVTITGRPGEAITASTFVASAGLLQVPGVAIASSGAVYAAVSDDSALVKSVLPSTAFADGRVGTGGFVFDVAFNSAGTTAYFINAGDQPGLGFVDVATNTRVALLGLSGARSVAVSSDDRKVYVARNPNVVTVVDAASRTIIRDIFVSDVPRALAWSPDGRRLYVTLGDPTFAGTGFVAEIDAVNDAVIRTMTIGSRAQAIAVSRDGSLLYVTVTQALEVWNLSTGTRTASVPLFNAGSTIQVTNDNARVWVPVWPGSSSSYVAVIDTRTLQVLTTIAAEGVYRIAFDRVGTTAALGTATGWVRFAGPGFVNTSGSTELQVGVAVSSGVGRVIVIPGAIALDSRGGARLEARLVDAGGHALPDPVTYSTSTSSIVSVDQSGNVTGLTGGTGSVTVSASTYATTIPVTVSGHPNPTLSATTVLPDPTFGTAVSVENAFYATRFTASFVARGTLPSTAIQDNVAVGSVPTSVAFSSTGATAYVTNQASGTLSIVDVATGTQTAAVSMLVPLRATPLMSEGEGGSRIDSKSAQVSDSVTYNGANVATSSQAAPISLLGSPFGVTVSPDDSKVYVGIVTSDIVQVVDPVLREVVRNITLGGSGPTSFAWTPDGTRLYVNSTSSGVITEINATTDVVLRTFSTGGRPQGMAVSRNGTELYVSDESRQMLDVWNLITGTRVAALPLGAPGLELGLTPDDARIWISAKTGGKILVFDRASRQLLQTVTTGGRPRQIAFDRYGTTGVVANDQANSVHFVR